MLIDAARRAAYEFLAQLEIDSLPELDDARVTAGALGEADVVLVLSAGADCLELEFWRGSPSESAWKRLDGVRVVYRLAWDGSSPAANPRWASLMDRVSRVLDEGRLPLDSIVQAAREMAAVPGVAAADVPASIRPFLGMIHNSAAPWVDFEIVATAWEVGVLAALSGGERATVTELSTRLTLSRTHLAALLRALHALGLLERESEETFRLSSAGLVLTGPSSGALESAMSQRRRWRGLSELVLTRSAGPMSASEWESLMQAFAVMPAHWPESQVAKLRAAGMQSVRHLLDVGSGSGAYARLFLETFDDLHVTLVDYPQAMPVARRSVEQSPGRTRAAYVAAAFYDASWKPPPSCDGVWFSNTLHVEGFEANLSLLRRLHDALPAGGRIWVQERLCNPASIEDCRNELGWMLHTSSGRAYTTEEVIQLLTLAGFSGARNLSQDDDWAFVTAARPP